MGYRPDLGQVGMVSSERLGKRTVHQLVGKLVHKAQSAAVAEPDTEQVLYRKTIPSNLRERQDLPWEGSAHLAYAAVYVADGGPMASGIADDSLAAVEGEEVVPAAGTAVGTVSGPAIVVGPAVGFAVADMVAVIL